MRKSPWLVFILAACAPAPSGSSKGPAAAQSEAPKAAPAPPDLSNKLAAADVLTHVRGHLAVPGCVQGSIAVGMPDGMKLDIVQENVGLSVMDPSPEAFRQAHLLTTNYRAPANTRFVFSRLMQSGATVGWGAFCVSATPTIASTDLQLITVEGTRAFEATPGGKQKLAHESPEAILFFVYDDDTYITGTRIKNVISPRGWFNRLPPVKP